MKSLSLSMIYRITRFYYEKLLRQMIQSVLERCLQMNPGHREAWMFVMQIWG